MGIELRFPNIAGTEKEQLTQIKSYLIQLQQQLEFAFNTVNTTGGTTVITSTVRQGAGSLVPSAGSSSDSVKTTFEQLKPLIIKSAEIVQAYSEIISKKIDGSYVAESDFGIYRGETNQALEATSEALRQNFTNTQTIISDLLGSNENLKEIVGSVAENVEKVNQEILETKAHIISGVLYESNGFPVYGVEIGQVNNHNGTETFNKFARFTADRLSFYDKNDIEVAYISDFKLYIGDVEITYRLVIGSVSETVLANGDVVAKRVIKKGG